MTLEVTKQSATESSNGAKVAFALGGLAGNNAHGAGVLQAALDCGLKPDLVSCTSGQIYWFSRYLEARPPRHSEGALRRLLEEDVRRLHRTNVDVLDAAWVALVGRKGAFRPALIEMPFNAVRNLSGALGRIVTDATSNWRRAFSAYRELACAVPAQTFVPLFGDAFFRGISKTFEETKDVGIIFNSYDVDTGEENVYLNNCARRLLNVEIGDRNKYREGTIYRRISPEAVREGLWIYEYGEPRDVTAIDGAYYRQIILSELAPARTIFVARPINSRWLGSFPTSWIGLQDLKTEVNFHGSYSGERDKIALVNKLLKDKVIEPEQKTAKKPSGYHEIKLVELEGETQRGYFDYAHESLPVFDRAYDAARIAFAECIPAA